MVFVFWEYSSILFIAEPKLSKTSTQLILLFKHCIQKEPFSAFSKGHGGSFMTQNPLHPLLAMPLSLDSVVNNLIKLPIPSD